MAAGVAVLTGAMPTLAAAAGWSLPKVAAAVLGAVSLFFLVVFLRSRSARADESDLTASSIQTLAFPPESRLDRESYRQRR